MATIRDVAKLAGVSVATVSRVLNNQGYVHEDTRKNVEQAIQSLNYQPNAVARSLFKKTSKTIGFIIPDITNPFFPQLVKTVEETLSKAGYSILLFNSDEQLENELKLIEIMISKYVDGIIIVSNTLKKEHLKNVKVPIVALDRVISRDIPSISLNNYEGAREAVRYLLSKGCSHIAHLQGPKDIHVADERLRGYIDELQEHKKSTYIYVGNYDLKTSMKSTMKLLSEHPEVDGIFAGNDIMAVGAIKAITELGLQIPNDIKVIGFDGIEWGIAITPELTTMEQPIYKLGEKSVELLLELMTGTYTGQKHYVFDANLIERRST
ncbi:LacI family DNA-binding transcriptional regulator [Bacillus sp. JJ1521]|uniref:LacI family DNA-binding transcriptional regulator n=1 Tax=Bacillus sp. JJ1521 TaxID=3122957 RepID=UPI002FFDA708